MDVREKLVELVHNARMNALWHNTQKPDEYITDMLMEDGVTVQEDCKACAEATQNCIVKLQDKIAELRSAQEWISVKDRLPEKEGDYLIYATAPFNGRKFMAVMHYEKDAYLPIWSDTTHWRPLPSLPQMEE